MTIKSASVSTNPFSTRYLTPGRLPWIDRDEETVSLIADRFHRLGGRGQIIGPHGSGKTTLLHHLAPLLGGVAEYWTPSDRLCGSQPVAPERAVDSRMDNAKDEPKPAPIYWFQLRRKNPIIPFFNQRISALHPGSLLIIDGFEQLNLAARWRVRWCTMRRKVDLLVTGHARLGLPTIFQTLGTTRIVEELVEQLKFAAPEIEPSISHCIERVDIADLVWRHQGNIRECLMELYDIFEIFRRESKR